MELTPYSHASPPTQMNVEKEYSIRIELDKREKIIVNTIRSRPKRNALVKFWYAHPSLPPWKKEGSNRHFFRWIANSLGVKTWLVSLALAARLKKSKRFFFRVCPPKGCSWSQKFLAESVEHGDKNGRVTKAMHKECRDFPVEVGSRFLWLESVDYFGTTDYFSGRKKT